MTARVARTNRAPQPAFEVLAWRQTWRKLEDGAWYREAEVRRADGELRLFLIRNDHPLAVAA